MPSGFSIFSASHSLRYEVVGANPAAAPKGKVPYIEDGAALFS